MKNNEGTTLYKSNSGFSAKSVLGAFNKLSSSEQVIALKSATALILNVGNNNSSYVGVSSS